MPRPHSMDLRERIAEAVHCGMSRQAAAKRFSVAASTAIKLMQAEARTGSLEPKKMGGYRQAILAPHEATVRALVKKTPGATLAELRESLRKKVRACARRRSRPGARRWRRIFPSSA